MGDVIHMQDRRPAVAPQPALDIPRRPRAPVSFWFDLASPATYFAAERVDRLFGGVQWVPVLADAVEGGAPAPGDPALEAAQAAARARAAALGVPLVWPEHLPVSFRAAMRIADYAGRTGRAPAFVLAASRMAFCGGFDLDAPDILAEACAAASLPLAEALRAAADRTIDGPLEARGRRLLAQGADRLPVVQVGPRLYCGEERLGDALDDVRQARVSRPRFVRP